MSKERVLELFKYDGWFDKTYGNKIGLRYASMKTALTAFLMAACEDPKMPAVIVETGCQRQRDDWGAGCSSQIFAEIVREFPNVYFVSVDIDPKNVALANEVVSEYSGMCPRARIVVGDSVEFLTTGLVPTLRSMDPTLITASDKINASTILYYIDSWDYPIVEIATNDWQRPFEEGMAELKAMSDEKFMTLYGYRVAPSQRHCLKETEAVLNHNFLGVSIIMFDDCGFPGGGKPRLAKEYLSMGWKANLLFEQCQSIWIV